MEATLYKVTVTNNDGTEEILSVCQKRGKSKLK